MSRADSGPGRDPSRLADACRRGALRLTSAADRLCDGRADVGLGAAVVAEVLTDLGRSLAREAGAP